LEPDLALLEISSWFSNWNFAAGRESRSVSLQRERMQRERLQRERLQRCDGAPSYGSAAGFPLSRIKAKGDVAMAWIDDESRSEPGETGLSAGRALYWLATIVAALIVIFALTDFFISWAQGAPIIRVFAIIAAAAVWLIGRACRALLS
jgi:hypothetical protein